MARVVYCDRGRIGIVGVNAFHIKVIAVVCMVSSHVGIFLLPQYPILILVGSVALPLFAWLIANGAIHTKDINAYLVRLFVFAVISQVPFTLANLQIGNPLFFLNIFFTLFLGLLAIAALQRTSRVAIRVVAIFACTAAAQLFNTDYGAAGVLAIVAFYIFFDRPLLMALSQVLVLSVVPAGVSLLSEVVDGAAYLYMRNSVWIPGIAAALCVIVLYNKREGIRIKHPFYFFYPLHFFGIYLLKLLL